MRVFFGSQDVWVLLPMDMKIVSTKSLRAWQILEKVYKNDNRVFQVRLQTLTCKFEFLRMNKRE